MTEDMPEGIVFTAPIIEEVVEETPEEVVEEIVYSSEPLTQKEKAILGKMTDEGLIKGAVREQVAASNSLARQMIDQYKAQKLNDLTVQIKNLEEKLKRLKELKAAMEAEET
jgi:hypothetical protein